MTFEEIASYCLSKPYAEETYPFDETTMVVKIGGKMFALLDTQQMETINLKHPSEHITALIEGNSCIQPGYHMSKKHWITVNYFHADIHDKDLLALIDLSYALVLEGLPKRMRIPLLTTFRTFGINDSAYEEGLALRQTILRDPLQLTLTKDDIKDEYKDIHIGGFFKDKLIAYCIITTLDQHQAKIRQVAVQQSLQGLGIGTTLMIFAEETATEQGIQSIVLHARNHVADWYTSIGYSQVGNEFLEVGIPHVKMIKTL
ncbi:MAG: GNAT family N-acetyltransferase [Bacteroidetes bacterium]|nr:GNAT family N-acetyltransferase [bacterium]NBP63548.1 GNAT family N-acetyltransferase [Bacteroidota bacterium]